MSVATNQRPVNKKPQAESEWNNPEDRCGPGIRFREVSDDAGRHHVTQRTSNQESPSPQSIANILNQFIKQEFLSSE